MKFSLLATTVMAFLLLTSCEQQPINSIPENAPARNDVLGEFDLVTPYYGSGPMLQLGDPLENPYHIDTVRKAYGSLVGRSADAVTSTIPVTHYYVRFLPQTSTDVDVLNERTELELFDFPLLYEISVEGNWYKDPTIDHGYPTWMYSVVPVDYEFPSMLYEILDPLHMPNRDRATGHYGSGVTATNLEDASYSLTGDHANAEGVIGSRGKYYPRGRIRVEENTLRRGNEGIDGLKRIKVRARRGLKYGTTHTDVDGTFKINKKFKYKVRYSVEFEAYDYKITNSIGFSINHAGPKTKSSWNHDFRFAGTEDWAHATLVQSISNYVVKSFAAELPQPESKKVKMRPKFEDGRSNAVRSARHSIPFAGLVVYNDVTLYMETETGRQLRTDELTSLMNHELAHVTHYHRDPGNWMVIAGGIVGESFAVAVEYEFTKDQYPNEVELLADEPESEIISGNWRYTPLCIDMLDNTNQRAVNGWNADFADDRVSGYSLKQILDAMAGADGLHSWGARLYNTRPTNSTRGSVNDLIDFYDGVREAGKEADD